MNKRGFLSPRLMGVPVPLNFRRTGQTHIKTPSTSLSSASLARTS